MNQHEVWSFVHTIDQNHLAEGLKNNDERIRKLTAQRIGVMRDPAEITHLIESLAQEHDTDVRDEIIKALTRMGEPAIPPLIQGLMDENEDIRRASAEGLGGIGCVAAIGNLCTATGDQNPVVRKAAVLALGRIGILNDEVEAKVLTCLDDEDKRVVLNAAIASGDLGCTAAVTRLISLLDDVTPYIKGYIIQILGKIGDDRATGKLCQLLVINDSPGGTDFTVDTSEREEDIIDALGKIADPRAVQPLIQELIYCVTCDKDNQECNAEDGCTTRHTDKWERSRPSNIVGNIHKALTLIGEPAIPPLIETLREWADNEECNEDSAECSCCQVSVSSEICLLLSEFGLSGIDTVLKLLSDEKVSVRKLAVKFFSEEYLDEKRVLDALIACMINDPDEKVKTLAAQSLGDGGQKSFEAIVTAIEQLHRPFTVAEIEAIGLIGSQVISNLTQCLDEPDEGKRRESLDAIRNLLESSPQPSRIGGLAALFG